MATISEDNQVSIIQSGINSHFIKMPLCYQETEYTCGTACVQSILASYGIVYRQDVLIDILKTKPITGTDYQNMISFLQSLGFQAIFYYDMDITLIKEFINRGITPILLIQAWKEDAIDYLYDWRDSHYTIACGYDDNRILFMDPYTLGNYTYIPNSELIRRWHHVDASGNHMYHCGLSITNENLQYAYSPQTIKHQA